MITQNIENILEELEQTQHDFWNVSRETANFLNMLVKMTNRKNVLEIGTSNGYSGIWLGLALKETNGKLNTIEFWDNRLSLAKENFKKCEIDNIITTNLGSALEIIPQLIQKEKFDMVFIDANKSEYVKYFDLLDTTLDFGAIIVADNVLSHAEKVKPFIDTIKNDSNYQTEILNLPAGLSVSYKIKKN